MMRLTVVASGPLTSVQDTGRVGAQRYGLPPSGAMDPMAMATANALVENNLTAPVLELGPLPSTFRVNGAAIRIAITGAGRTIEINEQAVKTNESVLVGDGQSIRIGFARGGIFSYLGISGRICGEPVLGSFSVTAGTGIGSPIPRVLQAGDEIEIDGSNIGTDLCIDATASVNRRLRVVSGPQAEQFGDELKRFLDSEWQVTPASNRMGYRLKGPRISHSNGHNIVSDGTVNGSIQIPGDGQPIVLMPDRGTTGGYPKIATVITSDLALLAQSQAGSTVRFEMIDIESAEQLMRDYLEQISSLPGRLTIVRHAEPNTNALLDANLAGQAINALDARTWHASPAHVLDKDS